MASSELQRILYVEDEADIRTVALMSLEKVGGFTVKPCSSGREAVEAAVAFAPDLVLLDVMMPAMDGPATLAALRALPGFANIPIVFMTAKAQTHEIKQYKALGAQDVISKPFDPMALPKLIEDIWKSRQV